MRTQRLQPLAVLFAPLLLLLAGCTSDNAGSTNTSTDTSTDAVADSTTPTTSPLAELDASCAGKSRHALLVGLDGVRSDAAQSAATPALDAIAADGVATFNAYAGGEPGTETEQPTLSGPGWTTILTGVWADAHGVTDNEFGGRTIENFPHFFDRLREAAPGIRTASFVHWIPLRVLGGNADVDELGDDRRVTDLAAAELRNEDPDVVFIHLDDVDGAGHSTEYSPDEPAYVSAIEVVDGMVGELSAAIDGRATRDQECWSTVVTTDHGGIGNGHGGQSDEERTIPLIVGGDGLSASLVDEGPGQVAVAPTIAAYLALDVDPAWGWEGEAFGVPSA